MTFHSLIWPLGCLSGAIAVLAGAYGSHGLPKRISEILGETGEPTSTAITVDRHVRSWQTAAHYQLMHSAMTLLSVRTGHTASAHLFMAGNVLFSGSIYALTLLTLDEYKQRTGDSEVKSHPWKRILGPVTPVGGLLYVCGWLFLLSRRGRW